ncbi:MAG TPA: hypothetical protein VF988_04690 [Verrucomicrobiae bacterium]
MQRKAVPETFRDRLLPVAQRVFWWGQAEDWLSDTRRFVAQIMTYGDWDDTTLTLQLLGNNAFRDVLNDPPPGVFDPKSWTFWHRHYQLDVPPLPKRKL